MSQNHCHDEHDHHHGGDGHAHDHSNDLTPALQNHLYEQIEWDRVTTLNEATTGSGRKVLQKTWAQRLDAEPVIESDADEQLIVHVPFAGQVRLHSIHLRTSASASAPSSMKVYANRDDLDFNSIGDARATQTFDLSQTSDVQDILVKRQHFNATRSLTLFFDKSFASEAGDDEETVISYIGFKGDFMKLNREAVEFLYEAAARPTDHKVAGKVGAGMGSSGLDGGGGPGF